MFKWFRDRQRVREIALAGWNGASPQAQLEAADAMFRMLPLADAFEYLEDRAKNSPHLAVRKKALEHLLQSGTARGLETVIHQMGVERESSPLRLYIRNFGVPLQLRSMGPDSVFALERHGKLILRQMQTEGYAALADEAEGLQVVLEGIGSAPAKDAVMRFRSSLSWHRKHSKGPPMPPAQLAPPARPTPPTRPERPFRPASAPKPELVDEALANEIKRLLLAASFHQSRDGRAFDNLSRQLGEIGDKLRDTGWERWQIIRRRVRRISAEHWEGLEEFYELLGPEPASSPSPANEPEGEPVSGRRILFGRRAIARDGESPEEDEGLPVLPAIDLAALAAAPARMSRCTLVSRFLISGQAHPEPEVVQAWAGALGADLQRALDGSPARQALVSVEDSGEQVLLVMWDDAVTREQVEKVAAAVLTYLGSQ